ncbi:MAG: hypothetical protein KDB22_11570 [Planctomycetales bacterium]|nr:hypothetical protein [Planctomycetales bacterium]
MRDILSRVKEPFATLSDLDPCLCSIFLADALTQPEPINSYVTEFLQSELEVAFERTLARIGENGQYRNKYAPRLSIAANLRAIKGAEVDAAYENLLPAEKSTYHNALSE